MRFYFVSWRMINSGEADLIVDAETVGTGWVADVRDLVERLRDLASGESVRVRVAEEYMTLIRA